MQHSTLAKRAWLPLFIVFAAFYLWGLGSLPLVGPDEPRYAQVAREMLARRDLITPTLGGLPWFEKPALLYWIIILCYRLFGVNEYAARLGPALCGLITGFFIWWIGHNVGSRSESYHQGNPNRMGRWAALVWLSSAGAIGFSRAASFDIVLTMTVTGAFAFFLVSGLRTAGGWGGEGFGKGLNGTRAALLLIGFYFFTGLSLLAKGLIGPVIIFGVLVLYYIVRLERPSRTFLKSLVWGLPIVVIVASVWYGPMIARHGRVFTDQFIVQHHFARFTSNKYHHPGPIYFYLPVVIGLALPWTIVLGGALVSGLRWMWRGPGAIDQLRIFALLWLILPMLFFSFSGSKLVAYVLPVLPAVALLAGERIACLLNAERGQKVLRVTGGMLLVLSGGAYWYLNGRLELNPYCLAIAILPLVLVGVAALVRPQIRGPLFVMIALAALVASVVALKCAAPVVARTASVRDLLSVAAARGYATTPIVQLHTVERTAEFYAAGRIAYGADGEPVKLEGAPQVLEAARQNNGIVLCLVPVSLEGQLVTYERVMSEVLADNGSVALIAVRPR